MTHSQVATNATDGTTCSRAKAQRPIKVVQPDGMVAVEKYGDVDHQAKKEKVDGMRSVIDKNRVDAIMSQISVMRGLEEILSYQVMETWIYSWF